MKKNRNILKLLVVCTMSIFAFNMHLYSNTQKFGQDIEITALPVLSGESTHGYTEYNFEITNYSKTQAHNVTIQMPDKNISVFLNNYFTRLSRTVSVPPSTTVKTTIMQQFVRLYLDTALIIVDSVPQDEILKLPYTRTEYYSYYKHYSVLHGKDIPASFINDLENKFSSKSSYSSNKLDLSRIDVPLTTLSSNELAYSRYDAIILTYNEFSVLNKSQQNALYRYTALGGNFAILGKLPSGKIFNCPTEKFAKIGFGLVYNFTKKPQKLEDIIEDTPSTDTMDYNIPLAFKKQIIKTSSKLSNINNLSSLNRSFPVVDNLSIPTKMIVTIMAIFIFIIIILTFTLTKLKNKSLYIYVILPIISLIFTIILIITTLINDGLTATVRTRTFTILNQNKKDAYTIGIGAYYSPISLKRGLLFDRSTEIRNLVKTDASFEVDETTGQDLLKGWIIPRTPSYFGIRKYERKRERILIKEDSNGNLQILNGFANPIKEFYYSDSKGNIYKAENIPAGKNSLLTEYSISQDNKNATKKFKLNKISYDFLLSFNSQNDKTDIPYIYKFLKSNQYIAVIKGSPFLENPIPNSIDNNSEAFVLGINLNELSQQKQNTKAKFNKRLQHKPHVGTQKKLHDTKTGVK